MIAADKVYKARYEACEGYQREIAMYRADMAQGRPDLAIVSLLRANAELAKVFALGDVVDPNGFQPIGYLDEVTDAANKLVEAFKGAR